MNLLFEEIDVLETTGDPSAVEVLGVEHDSRRVSPGDLFCCLPGHRSDGRRFAPEAVARGAVGLVAEEPVGDIAGDLPTARVARDGARPAMARLAAAFFGFPARRLTMAAVTGTNGKTTVTHLLATVLGHAGHPTEVIGTLSGARTTPESTELQRRLAEVRDRPGGGARRAVAMEVSSHALVQARVDAIHFDVAVFTNLSHDHLDYHGTMEAYFAAKASLFTPERARAAVVFADDPWGARLVRAARIPVVAVHRSDATDVELGPGVSAFTWRGQRVVTTLTGSVNVDNALLAGEAAVALGVEPPVVAAGLARSAPVSGRLQLVSSATRGDPTTVLVDYAHTPASLAAVLEEARGLAGEGRVLVVFGCGGDRDRSKRPMMGAVAASGADTAILTSDNPRHEDPDAIIAEVAAGVGDPAARRRLVVEPERRAAITGAIAAAGRHDVVVIAGKGHEGYQEVGDVRLPLDDRQVVREALAAGPGDGR